MKRDLACIDGWLDLDAAEPRLLGTRCAACGSIYFPPERVRCRNPHCGHETLETHALSTRGSLWSYTSADYQPPPPYIPRTQPYTPFAIAAVELEAERMIVLGQVADGVALDALRVGAPMQLDLGVLFETDDARTLTWTWRPATGGSDA